MLSPSALLARAGPADLKLIWLVAFILSFGCGLLLAPRPTADRYPSNAVSTAEAAALQILLSTRVCGSPATDGYRSVDAACLLESPTARWYRTFVDNGGDPSTLMVHVEPHADYDGVAIQWGIGNTKQSIEDCAQECHAYRPGTQKGPFGDLPCNGFVWCPADKCFQPDSHTHTQGDCWLKFMEAPAMPEVNARGHFSDGIRAKHQLAPPVVEWYAGVLLPPGVRLGNGTYSPRSNW